jgi:DNA-binding NarL/FixJ family response regulator
VISLFVKGFSESEIGDRLFISQSTVHNHTTHIYTKLGFTGIANPDRLLVAHAIKNKLVN